MLRLVGLWGVDGSSRQCWHVGCSFLAKFCSYCQNNSHVSVRNKGTLLRGHRLGGADVALQRFGMEGGSVGRETGQARVRSSCTSAEESQGVPHKPGALLLLPPPPRPLLVAFVFTAEAWRCKKKEKEVGGM